MLRLGVDISDEQELEQVVNKTSLKDVSKNFLAKRFGIKIEPKANLMETMDLYDAYVSSPNNIFTHHKKYIKEKVVFPLHPASILNDDNVTGMNIIGSLKFSEGGKFISDKNIVSDADLPQVLNLIATKVEYDDSKLISKDLFMKKYSNLPMVFHNFALKSRSDSGYRLLKWCARHVCDPNTPSLFGESFKLFKSCDGKIGFILEGMIPASMEKEEKYYPKNSFHFRNGRGMQL